MIVTSLFKSHYIDCKADKLMIVLHGKGDSMTPFKNFHKELRLQNINYLLLQAPKSFLNGYSWYGDPPYQRIGVLRVRAKLLLLMKELEEQGWPADKIYLFGFSQGALVCSDLALNYPKRFAGVIGISGYFQFYPRWRQRLAENLRTPWLFTHGRQDDVLPIETTRYGVNKLKWAGLKVDWFESNKDHDFDKWDYQLIRKWIQTTEKNQISSR